MGIRSALSTDCWRADPSTAWPRLPDESDEHAGLRAAEPMWPSGQPSGKNHGHQSPAEVDLLPLSSNTLNSFSTSLNPSYPSAKWNISSVHLLSSPELLGIKRDKAWEAFGPVPPPSCSLINVEANNCNNTATIIIVYTAHLPSSSLLYNPAFSVSHKRCWSSSNPP